MAPIFASIGITPQVIDDKRLRVLRSSLESIGLNETLENAHQISEPLNAPLDIERLVELLEPWQAWTFEEQVSFMNLSVRQGCRSIVDAKSHMRSNKSYFGRLTSKNGLNN